MSLWHVSPLSSYCLLNSRRFSLKITYADIVEDANFSSVRILCMYIMPSCFKSLCVAFVDSTHCPYSGPSQSMHQVSPLPPKLDRSGPRFDVFCFFCSCCVDILLLPSLLFVASGNTSPY